jgi:hypothetical protein
MPVHRPVKAAILLAWICALFLAACAAPKAAPAVILASPSLVTATPSPTTPTRTLAPPTQTLDPVKAELATRFAAFDITATVQALTPSPTATATQTQVPTATIVPTGAPLQTGGPWLLITQYGKREWRPPRFSVMDTAAKELQALNMPPLPEDRMWEYAHGEKGSYLAFHASTVDINANALRPDGIDDVLWIYKLPENRVVRKIPLLGQAAWHSIDAERKTVPPETAPALLGILDDRSSFQWSPDGRYLVYPAAVEGPLASLYLYDTQTDETRRLTRGRVNVQPWFWSADGRRVIFREGIGYDLSYNPVFMATSVSVDDLDGVERKLYETKREEAAGGQTGRDFLVYNTCFECEPHNLRLVDFITGETRVLREDLFPGYSYDPASRTLLINFTSNASWARYPQYDGIYRIDMTTGHMEKFITGDFSTLIWLPEINLFAARQRVGENETKLIFFTSSGKIRFSIPGAEYERNPSPNGRWVIVRVPPKPDDYAGVHLLVDSIGNRKPLLPFPGEAYWLPDSSGFYTISEDGGFLVLYRSDTNWQPESQGSFLDGDISIDIEIIAP